MISFQRRCAGPAMLLIMLALCSCQDQKMKILNDVVNNDPKVRSRAISELRRKPDPAVLKNLMAKYEHGAGETKLRAGHALLEVTDSINKMSKGEKDDDSRWGGAKGEADAKRDRK